MLNSESASVVLRQEVEELTSLLRQADSWEDLRQALATKQLSADDVLLATFSEDEQNGEFGIFVTLKQSVFEYERTTQSGAPKGFLQWRDRTGDDPFAREHPQVIEALAMISGS